MTSNSELLGHRVENFRVELLDLNDNVLGPLDAVQADGGQLDFSVYADIRGSGNLTLQSASVDWTRHRVRVSYELGSRVVPLITAVVKAPVEAHTDTGVTVDVELYDKTLILSEDSFGVSYAVPAGTNPITAVADIIVSTGQPVPALLTPTTDTLALAMVWEAGTTKLKIVNDLLDAAGYFALYADGMGHYVAAPYTSPQTRPTMWDFTADALYTPRWTRDADVFSVPNRYICVGATSGETPALMSTAVDTSEGPFSYSSRGRWITRTDTDVEATSQAVLDLLAERRLHKAQQVTETLTFEHPWLPFGLNEVVQFGTVRAVVWKQSVRLSVGGLITSTARRLT